MRFGENIQRLGAWALVFVVAQGMVYRWGYDQGYFHGSRQGYCDFFQERTSQQSSAEALRADAAATDAAADPAAADALVPTREVSTP